MLETVAVEFYHRPNYKIDWFCTKAAEGETKLHCSKFVSNFAFENCSRKHVLDSRCQILWRMSCV